jgi:ketosteroid isomerase-like protein
VCSSEPQSKPRRSDIHASNLRAPMLTPNLSMRDTEPTMSEQNVEVVRRTYDAFNRRDFDTLVSEIYDPQIEWQTSREDPDAATHRGPEAVRRYGEGWIESFEGLQTDLEELIEADDGRVYTWGRWCGRGRGSGIESEWWLAIVLELRNGKIVRADEYFDRGEALEAAGLSE